MDYSKDFKHVHFIGIGGIGMSAVAEVMLERGFVISGSDLNESDQVQMLRGRGATIHVPQRAETSPMTSTSSCVPQRSAKPTWNIRLPWKRASQWCIVLKCSVI